MGSAHDRSLSSAQNESETCADKKMHRPSGKSLKKCALYGQPHVGQSSVISVSTHSGRTSPRSDVQGLWN